MSAPDEELTDKDLIDLAAHYYHEINFNPNNTSNRVDSVRLGELGHEINKRGLSEALEHEVKKFHNQPPAQTTKQVGEINHG